MNEANAVTPIQRLLEVMARLRGPGGCPWDREQTLQSLKPYCIEEAYEVLDAIDGGDPAKHCDELGDLLLQVVFQSQLRLEEGAFTFDDVATAIANKLVRRHPHVFGDVAVSGSDEVLRNWDEIKKKEKGAAGASSPSVLSDLPKALPALARAQEIQKRAARVGFDWPDPLPVLDKIEEEIRELRAALAAGDAAGIHEETGDLLFSVVNLARKLKVHSEEALHSTTGKFVRRFLEVERAAAAEGRDLKTCTLAELDRYWNDAKAKGL
jgi:MazG family protein